jgi:hypothetical protein
MIEELIYAFAHTSNFTGLGNLTTILPQNHNNDYGDAQDGRAQVIANLISTFIADGLSTVGYEKIPVPNLLNNTTALSSALRCTTKGAI